jgi:hypothetical protein
MQDSFSQWVVASDQEKSRMIRREIREMKRLGLIERTQGSRSLQPLFGIERWAAFSKFMGQLSNDLTRMKKTLNF